MHRNMSQRKRNIECSKPEEPAFLKKLKSQIGFQGNSIETIDTKKDILDEANENDVKDRDDEQPVYIVTDNSNITTKELDEFKTKVKFDEDEFKKNDIDLNKKILFKKPTSKSNDNLSKEGMQSFQGTKKGQSNEIESKLNKSQIKPVKNCRLLSFDDDEEDDD